MDNFFEGLMETFKEEAEELLASWESCVLNLESHFDPETIKELFRVAHTLKGSSKTVGLEEFGVFVHKVEDLLKDLKSHPSGDNSPTIGFLLDCHQLMVGWISTDSCDPQAKQKLLDRLGVLQGGGDMADATPVTPTPAAHVQKEPTAIAPAPPQEASEGKGSKGETSHIIRVNRLKIDKMINLVGELGTQLTVLEHQFQARKQDSQESQESLVYCLKYIKLLQEYTISLGMQPIDRFMQRLERSCKDVARTTGKKIDVEKIGMSIELDKTVLDQIADPFIHIVRNAADHGIEDADTRIKNNKSPTGKITLKAVQKSDLVEFTVQDDGGGLDRERIYEKAVKSGLIGENETVSDDAIYQMIMKPGFSTKAQVTEISGRGVGLDVVSESLIKLGGSLKIDSKKNQGTQFIISIPTNFSMVEAVLVSIASNRYAIPLKDFAEIIDLSDFNLQLSDCGSSFFKMREEIVSIYNIKEFLRINRISNTDQQGALPDSSQGRAAVINRNSQQPIAFEIDKLFGRLNLFVKPLNGKFANMPGVSGTAILPDGQAGLVLNLGEIANTQEQQFEGKLNYG